MNNPQIPGVYAVRIDDPQIPNMHTDRFMLWHSGRWSYLGSGEYYRGTVHQWVGPIPRTLPE